MKKSITSILLACAIVFGIACFSWIRHHGFQRPYINWGIAELAEYLVQNHHPASECFNLVWYEIGMQQGEAQAECVYRYAEKSKDPSACKLLMPSSYGLDCVGGAKDFHLPCETEKYTVYWDEAGLPKQTSLKVCTSPTATGMSTMEQQCCVVAKARYLLNENDCAPVKNDKSVYDQCLYGLAWKKKDPAFCKDIQNKNVKSACMVETAALKKDPSICEGCTKPVGKIEDLPR